MKRKWVAFAVILVIVLLFALAMQGQSQGIFYRVTGGKSDMYILGSIHIGSRQMYPFGPAVRQALRQADLLVFECDTQSEQAVAATQTMMRYPQGDTLADHVSDICFEKLIKTAQKTGYDINALKAVKPWAITSMFSMDTLSAQMGSGNARKAAALGVEEAVRKQAGLKKRGYLETVEEQFGLMDDFSADLQEYLLESACDTILDPENALDEDLSKWPEWWMTGDANAFADSYLNGLKAEKRPELAREYHDALVTSRNRSMAQKLAGLLEDDETGSSFVTVGLMHLVLPKDSIVHELQLMGYQVEKIEN